MKRERLNEFVELVEGDCLEVLPQLDAAEFDGVISDPPYGIGFIKGKSGGQGSYRGRVSAAEARHDQPIIGDDKPFDPAPLIRFKNVLIWGANHYAKRLPDGGRWLAWNKLAHLESFDSFSDVEFAWHSIGKASRVFNYMWKNGLACVKKNEDNGRRSHPTQKPVGLMRWCIEQSKIPVGGKILDPYAGSGTTALAASKEGRHCLLIEIDPRYCDVIRRRFERFECRQPGSIFANPVQRTLADSLVES